MSEAPSIEAPARPAASPYGGAWFFGLFGPSAWPVLTTERLVLRPPARGDYTEWARVRRASERFLRRWEPRWADDHLSYAAFRRRVRWSRAEIYAGRTYPFLIFAHDAGAARLVGGVTLEHVRRGAAQAAALGYWLGAGATGHGYMGEALRAVAPFAFADLALSRIEAACLPENEPSQRVLERAGFRFERRAAAYLQICGVWRDHLIYERRRPDRVDRAPTGL